MKEIYCVKNGSFVYWQLKLPAPVAQLDRAPGYEPGGLEVRTLSGAMIIHAVPSGPYATNAYVLGCPQTKQAVIIDPSPGSLEPVSQYLQQYQLIPEKILLTHSHWDHIADVSKFKRAFQIPVWVHSLDEENLKSPGADGIPFRITIEGVEADHQLTDGEKFFVGSLEFHVLHTPGHSPGSVCFYLVKEGILMSGDTLFRGSMGTLALPTANAEQMWASLKRLSKLPPEIVVYPGHASKTTIGREAWLSHAEQVFG